MPNNRERPTLAGVSFDIGTFFAGLERHQALEKLRKEHSYLADLIRVLIPNENGLRRSIILSKLEHQRRQDGLPIPKNFEQAVQSCYNQRCSDSSVFKRRGGPNFEALFYSPGGKGSGSWAVNRGPAIAWLAAQQAKIEIEQDDSDQDHGKSGSTAPGAHE